MAEESCEEVVTPARGGHHFWLWTLGVVGRKITGWTIHRETDSKVFISFSIFTFYLKPFLSSFEHSSVLAGVWGVQEMFKSKQCCQSVDYSPGWVDAWSHLGACIWGPGVHVNLQMADGWAEGGMVNHGWSLYRSNHPRILASY